MKERERREVNPEFAEPDWITAEEYAAKVAEAKKWQVEARADREFYANENFWYGQSEPERDYSGERG